MKESCSCLLHKSSHADFYAVLQKCPSQEQLSLLHVTTWFSFLSWELSVSEISQADTCERISGVMSTGCCVDCAVGCCAHEVRHTAALSLGLGDIQKVRRWPKCSSHLHYSTSYQPYLSVISTAVLSYCPFVFYVAAQGKKTTKALHLLNLLSFSHTVILPLLCSNKWHYKSFANSLGKAPRLERCSPGMKNFWCQKLLDIKNSVFPSFPLVSLKTALQLY